MLELGPENVVAWLREQGRLPADGSARAELLGGGVSNVVIRIHPTSGPDFIIKQARERLRTEAEWFSRLDRIWREADVMRDVEPLVPPGFVPRVLFENRDDYAFAMQAVPDGHVVWKSDLLAGRFDPAIACRLAAVTRTIHESTSARHGFHPFRGKYGDREVFDQLRIDPFYRRTAARHRDLRGPIDALIRETLETSCCLVHGDLSPKNLLVTRPESATEPAGHPPEGADADDAQPQLTLVDYEVAHYGDPAFDLGFLLSHLLLKAVRHQDRGREVIGLARTFWSEYAAPPPDTTGAAGPGAFPAADVERRSVLHLAACMLARIDGTSPVEYLPEPSRRDFVRSVTSRVLLDPPDRLEGVLDLLETELETGRVVS